MTFPRAPLIPCALSALALGGALACAPGAPGGQPAGEGAGLRDVEVPADFTFATSRPVALTVQADPAVVGGQAAGLEVRRLDGAVLYRGPLLPDRPLEVSLALPTTDDALELHLATGAEPRVERVALTGARTSYAFR